MSKYTTELRYILEQYAGYTESVPNTDVTTVIAASRAKLFDFPYPIFDESYRITLETLIMLHYYTREIGYETVGRFKLGLRQTLNDIMPYYNKLYESALIEIDPLRTIDITRTSDGSRSDNRNLAVTENTKHDRTDETESSVTNKTTTADGSTTESVAKHDLNTTVTDNGTESSNVTSEEDRLYSDTPQGTIDNVKDGKWLTNATVTSNVTGSSGSTNETSHTSGLNTDTVQATVNATGSSDGESAEKRKTTSGETGGRTRTDEEKTNGTDKRTETEKGYVGRSAAALLMEYRETFLNIDLMVINDLEDLFMQIW